MADLFEGFDQVAGQESVSVRLSQHALGDLPCDRALPPLRIFRRGGNKCPDAASDVDSVFRFERSICVLNGVGVDLQLLCELSDRWERVARLEHADGGAPLDFLNDLAEDGTGVLGVDLEA